MIHSRRGAGKSFTMVAWSTRCPRVDNGPNLVPGPNDGEQCPNIPSTSSGSANQATCCSHRAGTGRITPSGRRQEFANRYYASTSRHQF